MAEAAIVFPENHLSFEAGRAAGLLPGPRAQEVKSAVHRELIDKADLEKLLYLQDTRGRQQLFSHHSATGGRLRGAVQRQRADTAGQ